MSAVSLLTALNLPSVSISPSVNCLQFSEDGQAVLLTKYAVYILTPDAGVNVELSSVMKHASDSKPLNRTSAPTLGWLRTVVEFDRCLAHQWQTDCQDWGSVCLGSLDPSLQALALSPSDLTSNGGCVLALLNSNLELTIWGAPKNFLTGEWIRLQDVTSLLKEAAAKASSSALARTLQAQSTCIEWAQQPDWGLTPTISVDASLLAVGNRAGSVTFLRFSSIARELDIVDRTAVSDRWLTHLAWSAWRTVQDRNCEAMLACGAPDGSVVILNVRQTLTLQPSLAKMLPDYEFGLSVRMHGVVACEADGRAITGLRWVNLHGRSPILIIHKAGSLHLWSPQSPQSEWSGSKVLLLRTQKRSVGSSALSQASGICYIPDLDVSVVALSDGSFHAIYQFSVDPTLDPPTSEVVSSDTLSAASRSVFLQSEPEEVTSKDVDRINGMSAYDERSTFMWAYEASRPTDFSYKHDAKHTSSLVVAQLYEGDTDEQILKYLAERVGLPSSGFGQAPIGRLRPIFLHLRDPHRIARLHDRILDILHHVPAGDSPVNVVIPTYTGDRSAELSREFVKSLTTHLFGWHGVQSQRTRYAVATFCQAQSAAAELQRLFADAANYFVSNIRAHLLLTLLRHFSAVRSVLNASDIYFARRTVLLAKQDPSSALAKEAEELSAQFQLPAHAECGTDVQNSLDELCPACHTSISLRDPESAACENGHIWARCCVTSLLLATPMVRTCVGCSRKAFVTAPAGGAPVHDSGWLPNPARDSWVLRDLLEAARRCPFCGNNFVTLV